MRSTGSLTHVSPRIHLGPRRARRVLLFLFFRHLGKNVQEKRNVIIGSITCPAYEEDKGNGGECMLREPSCCHEFFPNERKEKKKHAVAFS